MTVTAAQWLVLDNIAHGWHYGTGLDRALADEALRQCLEAGWVKNGEVTGGGETASFLARAVRRRVLG